MPAHVSGTDKEAGWGAPPLYADVVVPRGPRRPFTYLIPSGLQGSVAVGQRVIVPFGASTVSAVVVGLRHHLPSALRARHLKPIQSSVTAGPGSGLFPAQLQLSRWLSERYLAPWGQCVRYVSPPAESEAKSRTKWFITPEGRRSLSIPAKLTIAERGLLERLAHRPSGVTWQTLKRAEGASADAARTALMRRKCILEQEVAGPSRRRPTGGRPALLRSAPPDYPGWQEGASREASARFGAQLRRLSESGRFEMVVLQASFQDRMKVLVQAVHDTLHSKRRVLIVSGEVRRARDIGVILVQSGIEHVHLYHGSLPIRERGLAWQRMLDGQATVVVGTRSAAFSPVQDLGLVWVDGEEDVALKEEQAPRYHAREVARMRAQLDQAILVLASPHPSLECLHAAETGHATLWSIPADNGPAPIEAIDLRRVSGATLLSPRMVDGIRKALAGRALIVLYLNRKGYAALILCRSCGQAPSCPGCSLALRFHKKTGRLVCHYCGHQTGVPDVCPACRAAKLDPLGAGTERAEELLRQHFPHIRIGRIDGESTRQKKQRNALLDQIRAGEVDVIIGTQMLFLHGEIPPAGLVGVLYADAGLHMPDFRAAEHAYHALQDAVALARADGTGRVLIQTYFPDHHAIQAVVRHDESVFNEPELAFRRALHYPPFSHLVRLDVSGTSERHVKSAADRWATALRGAMAGDNRSPDGSVRSHDSAGDRVVAVLGPAPAPVPRLRKRYRWQLLVRSDSQKDLLRVVSHTLPGMEGFSRSGGIKLTVDVDPVAML